MTRRNLPEPRACLRCTAPVLRGETESVGQWLRKIYCSTDCAVKSRRARGKRLDSHASPRPCIICGTEFRPKRQSGNARYCKRECVGKALAMRNREGREAPVRILAEHPPHIRYEDVTPRDFGKFKGDPNGSRSLTGCAADMATR